MRILQVIQKPQLRGAEIFATQLSNQVQAAGHEVGMISLIAGEAVLPFRGELIQLNRPLKKRLFDLSGWKLLRDCIKEFKPDVVQANAGDTLKFAVLSKFFFHWESPIVFRNANKVSDFIDSWPKLLFNKFLVNQVSHVISVSELCRRDFVATYSFDSSKTTTVPIGIDLQINSSLPTDLKNIFSSRKVMVHVASFVPEKNHYGLLRILRLLVTKNLDVNLVLIGDGKLRSTIEKQIIDLNLSDRVFLLGYRTDVLSIINNAQVFVLPSLIEGLPGVILEAMYCRTPVVAYDVGGISEVVKTGETGWLVKAGDEEGFVAAIEKVLISDRLNLITNKAHDLVVSEFDNKLIAEKFMKVYEKIVNRKGAKLLIVN
jgi:glycosyltransferase involved in cell wall biosynthesis